MKTKELDPANLGRREDWEGNNIAFECPVCSELFIVSAKIHRERPCPSCGKSRGMVTGGRDSGGKASITWEDAPTFQLGKAYTRKVISSILGGSEIEYLPMENGRVVCGCFTLDHNPEAPDIVIPGNGRIIKKEAGIFCKQDYPIPVFIKRRVNEWEYVGHYKVARFSEDSAEIATHHCGSVTPLHTVTRVIYLALARE